MRIRNLLHAVASHSFTIVVLLATGAAGATNVFTAGTGDFHDPAAWSPAAYKNSHARAFYFTNDGANAAFQLQYFENGALSGKFVKCVKVALTQQPDGIHGRAVYARYRDRALGYQVGFDFDTLTVNGTIATSLASAGYGCPALPLATPVAHGRHGPVSGLRQQRHLLRKSRTQGRCGRAFRPRTLRQGTGVPRKHGSRPPRH